MVESVCESLNDMIECEGVFMDKCQFVVNDMEDNEVSYKCPVFESSSETVKESMKVTSTLRDSVYLSKTNQTIRMKLYFTTMNIKKNLVAKITEICQCCCSEFRRWMDVLGFYCSFNSISVISDR